MKFHTTLIVYRLFQWSFTVYLNEVWFFTCRLQIVSMKFFVFIWMKLCSTLVVYRLFQWSCSVYSNEVLFQTCSLQITSVKISSLFKWSFALHLFKICFNEDYMFVQMMFGASFVVYWLFQWSLSAHLNEVFLHTFRFQIVSMKFKCLFKWSFALHLFEICFNEDYMFVQMKFGASLVVYWLFQWSFSVHLNEVLLHTFRLQIVLMNYLS